MPVASSFDIFRVDHEGMVWCEAATTLELAKARVAALAAGSAQQYLIFNQATQQSIFVTGDKTA